MLGLLKPDAGAIFVNGEQVDDMTRRRADGGPRRSRHGVPGRRAVRLADRARERRLQAVRGDCTGRSTRRTRGSRKCSASSGSASSSTGCRRSCRAGSAAASPSRARWRPSRASCSTTSRRPGSIRSPSLTVDEEIIKLRDLEGVSSIARDAPAARRVLRRRAHRGAAEGARAWRSSGPPARKADEAEFIMLQGRPDRLRRQRLGAARSGRDRIRTSHAFLS